MPERARSPAADRGPERAGSAEQPALFRGHRGIKTAPVDAEADGFREDRHVLRCDRRGEIIRLPRTTTFNPPRGRRARRPAAAPMTARVEWVASHPATIPARL